MVQIKTSDWIQLYVTHMMSSIDFLFNSGTLQSLLGKPTGNIRTGLSFTGLFNNSRRAFEQFFGVYVRVTNPALCMAVKRMPEAIETLVLW